MPRLPDWVHRLRRLPHHPWRAAASWASSSLGEAEARLRYWRTWGIPAEELLALAAMPSQAPDPTELPVESTTICSTSQQLHSWQWQAWLQHVPLQSIRPDAIRIETSANAELAARRLNIEPLPSAAGALELAGWTHHSAVFDIDPIRVACLKALGVRAYELKPSPTVNGWLDDPSLLDETSRRLGLPHPSSLGHSVPIVLGTTGPSWERSLDGSLWAWPGFDLVKLLDPQDARCLAAWLNHCQLQQLQLVRLQPRQNEREQRGFEALAPAPEASNSTKLLPCQAFIDPINAQTLLKELCWRHNGAAPAPPCITPQPDSSLIWEHNTQQPVTAAICISLFNYAERISAALNSAQAQTNRELELIIVDDASTDHGLSEVQAWLQRADLRFNKVSLLKHHNNAGLAAARNTAFAHASAEWCFVLDADNALMPNAVECCLKIAQAAPVDAAVVHPLVEVISDENWQDHRSLISSLSWQRAVLEEYNVVDAMALIRRSAWASVGGFEHIPHGWEDYDFWCKLIEAGYHGVLCPQKLAVYNSHGASMMSNSTLPHLRSISRMLQQRHPWLRLPYAKGSQEGWAE